MHRGLFSSGRRVVFYMIVLMILFSAACGRDRGTNITEKKSGVVTSSEKSSVKTGKVAIEWGKGGDSAEYIYSSGILSGGMIYQPFTVRSGSGEIVIKAEADGEWISETFTVSEGKKYTLKISFGLAEGKTEAYKQEFVISSDASEKTAIITVGFRNYVMGSVYRLKMEDPDSKPTIQSINGIAWNGSRFAAVCGDGTVILSYDGTEWETVRTGTDAWLEDIIWTGEFFIAVGGRSTIMASIDGETWDIILGSAEGHGNYDSGQLSAIAWNGKMFTAGGMNGLMLTSRDAKNWTIADPDVFDKESITCIASSNDVYVAFCDGRVFYTSGDGEVWERQDMTEGGTINDVVWSNNIFVAVGLGGTVITSNNGKDWIICETDTDESLLGIASGDGSFLAAGCGGTVLMSEDGEVWKAAEADADQDTCLTDAAWGDGRYIAVAEDGTVTEILAGQQ